MHIFCTILVSGFLIFTEVPAAQLPPPDVNQPTPNTVLSSPDSKVAMPTAAGESYPDPAFDPSYTKSAVATVMPSPTVTAQPKATLADAALATYRQQSVLPISGYAMYYNPNIMQEVLRYRLDLGQVSQCAECIGNVALLRAGDLNRRVWLQWEDGVVEGPFLVVDAAAQHHVAQLLSRQWVVDVDNRTAVRRGMAGPVLVTVWGSPPVGQPGAPPPPFAPLYSTVPIDAVVPNNPPSPEPSATPYTVLETVLERGQGGFPTNTPIPTITPLPFITSMPPASSLAMPSEVAAKSAPPASDPAPLATAVPTLVPTMTPSPVVTPTPFASAVVVRGGFPTETPVPTITPLPFIGATTSTSPAATSLPIAPTPTLTSTPVATPVVAATPTQSATPTRVPTQPAQATSTTLPPVDVVVPQGFPTDTPVPTITPLPALTPLPSPEFRN